MQRLASIFQPLADYPAYVQIPIYNDSCLEQYRVSEQQTGGGGGGRGGGGVGCYAVFDKCRT